MPQPLAEPDRRDYRQHTDTHEGHAPAKPIANKCAERDTQSNRGRQSTVDNRDGTSAVFRGHDGSSKRVGIRRVETRGERKQHTRRREREETVGHRRADVEERKEQHGQNEQPPPVQASGEHREQRRAYRVCEREDGDQQAGLRDGDAKVCRNGHEKRRDHEPFCSNRERAKGKPVESTWNPGDGFQARAGGVSRRAHAESPWSLRPRTICTAVSIASTRMRGISVTSYTDCAQKTADSELEAGNAAVCLVNVFMASDSRSRPRCCGSVELRRSNSRRGTRTRACHPSR